MSVGIPCTSSRATPRYKTVVQFIRMWMAHPATSSPLTVLRGLAPSFSPLGPSETSPVVVGRSLSDQKQTAFVATAERHEGNRLETTSRGGSGDGGHEEIARLPSNDVTTNANLITGPDIANRPGPVTVVVWGFPVSQLGDPFHQFTSKRAGDT